MLFACYYLLHCMTWLVDRLRVRLKALQVRSPNQRRCRLIDCRTYRATHRERPQTGNRAHRKERFSLLGAFCASSRLLCWECYFLWQCQCLGAWTASSCFPSERAPFGPHPHSGSSTCISEHGRCGPFCISWQGFLTSVFLDSGQ